MKIFIYAVCIILLAIIQVIIKDAGIILGGIPTAVLYAAFLGLASMLCKLWDKRNK